VKRPIIWEQLVDRVKRELNNRNAFAASSQAGLSGCLVNSVFRSDGSGFTLKTPSFPLATLEASFQDKRLVRLDFSFQKSDLADPHRWSEFLEFKVDENDNAHLQHKGEFISVDDAALLILMPLMRDPGFRPPVGSI
jgi:hypothetical protein